MTHGATLFVSVAPSRFVASVATIGGATIRENRSRLRNVGQADRVERIEITAEITEAWQGNCRDYATAYIDGSIVDYTVDEVTHSLIHGSRTVPKAIEEFWTFTRPAGLNFWMLSAIRTA